MTDFAQKRVLVTGSSTGIGAATALHLAERGAKVLITARDAAALDAVARKHPAIVPFPDDLADPGAPARLVREAERALGGLDVLVNNAATAPIAPLADATHAHARTILAVNVEAVIELTRLALPLLRASGGNVVNVTSTVADEPFANMSVYCASKAAVLALTRSWAQELAADGVRVNAVSPGCIETPIYLPSKLGVSEEAVRQIASNVLPLIPARRFGRAEEVAPVIAFLASPAASYVTGAEWTVGGGLEA